MKGELKQFLKEIDSKDAKTSDALRMMLKKAELLEKWRKEGLPEVIVDEEPVLYSKCPINPSQFMAWEDETLGVLPTSRAFYYRKVKKMGGMRTDCPTVKKLRNRAEKSLDYWKSKGKNRQKRNKEIQLLRDKIKLLKEEKKRLFSQVHMILEQKDEAERRTKELNAEKKVLKRQNSELTEKTQHLQDILKKYRGGLRSIKGDRHGDE